MRNIEITKAKTHNLKNVSLKIPKHKFVVFTGVSGSGKSSLVFDTIYTESQRQLIDTFSTFARRRLPKLSRPPVDEIKNISTCIVIDQKRLGRSSRSTVGTVTEIYTYLRMLFSRCGRPFIGWSHLFSFNHPEGMCQSCKGIGKRITIDIDKLLDLSKSITEGGILHPNYEVGKWYWREILDANILPADKKLKDFTKEEMNLLLYAEDYPIQYEYRGEVYKRKFMGVVKKLEKLHIDKDEDELAGTTLKAYQRLFSLNTCPNCEGARLNKKSLEVKLANGMGIKDLVDLELTDLDIILNELPNHKGYAEMKDVVSTLVNKIRTILISLIDIGVGYLSLNRSISTLSGGESQRVKMAKQLHCDLVDLMYIMDEPSIGLHPRDIDSLIRLLYDLRDKGNSVLVVEHDTEIIRSSDWIVEVGPKAGKSGGEILFSGEVEELLLEKSPTAIALTKEKEITKRKCRTWESSFSIKNANKNNLKDVSVKIPEGVLTCLTGVAGSGKSSLVEEFIDQHKKNTSKKIIVIDQKPVGRSSRSNPATYIGVFDRIRKIFAIENNVTPSLFSFNSAGACLNCKGHGFVEMELSFIDDVKIECGTCNGKRYTDDVLNLKFNKKSIHEVLTMTVEEAIEFFASLKTDNNLHLKKIVDGLKLLQNVGVGYLELGQSLSTLSGGEAQRLKLASELKKSGNIYIMDEPTTGLHSADIRNLLRIINNLIDAGNSVLVIEHNLDVIRQSDWIIDIGPFGGKNGGSVIAEGSPMEVSKNKNSATGRYLV